MELSNPWIRQGRREGEAHVVVRQLTKRLGPLSPERVEAIQRLPIEQLEDLADAIFEITSDADLAPWLG